MAAAHTLPPIQGAKNGGMVGMAGGMKHSQPVHFAPAPPKGPPSGRLKPLKKKNKVHSQNIVSQQPLLTKQQTTAYRNTYKHNLCVDMLQEGFHKSFCELFALIKQQEDDRIAAGPESLMWTMVLLKDEHEKLDMLKVHLTKAETAARKGDFQEVYRCRFDLARYFQSSGDKWLADHFFNTCLQTSAMVTTDGGKMQAEGYCNVALAQEENGDNQDACKHFESYYNLASQNKDWVTADDITYHTDSCINLSRIYTTLGEIAENESLELTLDYLNKAYNMARESQQQKLEGESAYRLGLVIEKTGDGAAALSYLNNYLSICRAQDDTDGIGKACDAIAKAFARQGKVEESIEYLKQFVEVAEKSGQEQAYSKACHNLGNIFNSLGNYEEATKYFDKAYNLSRSMGEVAAINVNRVQFGIAMAHKMMPGFGGHVVINKLPTVERLIEWKSSRVDEFEKPIPEPSVEVPKTPSDTQAPQTPAKEDTQTSMQSEQESGDQSPREVEQEGTVTSMADTETENQD